MRDRITVVMIRHPHSEGNEAGKEMVNLEKPNHLFLATQKGLLQVEQAIIAYRERFERPDAIYHSTFARTKVLAQMFSDQYGVSITEDSRLDEKWDGIFHSLPPKEIEQRYPDQIALKKKYGWYHNTPVGGENGPAVELRQRSFFQDMATCQYYQGKTILLGVHGVWQHLFEKWALGIPWQELEQRRKTHPFPNCSISAYNFYPPFQFECFLNRHAPWQEVDEPAKYA